MKIYFVGAHSTGKTTLARYVAEKLKLPMLTEAARAVLAEKELQLDTLRTDLKAVDEYQTAVFHKQLESEETSNSFVADRGFDCLAYAAQHSRVLKTLMESKEFNEYLEKFKEPNNYVFFVRPSKATMKEDGTRESLNWDGIVAIDAMVKFMLKMWEIPHFQINMDSMQERTIFIDSIIRVIDPTIDFSS